MSLSELRDSIKQSPISAIIGHYIPLSKKGQNYEGICPFHSDTKPSLKINDSKELYKCFACGAAGDSIHFVEEFKHLDFREAMIEIAGILGIRVDEQKLSKQKEDPKFAMAQRILHSAMKIYRKVGRELKEPAMEEFINKRGLTEEIVDHFQLGFAPRNNVLLHYLMTVPENERNLALSVAQEIGIIKKGDRGLYDTFRNRVMFPVWDHFGILRGFSSRAVLQDQIPKYLNSGESFAFEKRHILFALNFAKPAIREKNATILVEGHMDAIALHQYGFKNAVATMGTAMGPDMADLLKKFGDQFYLALDTDDAGWKATKRLGLIFYEHKIMPKVIRFDPYKDPDEFLMHLGALELQKRIDEAPTLIDLEVKEAIALKQNDTTEEKLKILEQVFHILSPWKDSLLAKEMALEASKLLKIQSGNDDIIESYKKFLSGVAKEERFVEKIERPSPKQIQAHAPSFEPAKPIKREKNLQILTLATEKALLKSFLLHPELMEHVKLSELLDVLSSSEVKRIVEWLTNLYREVDEAEFANVVRSRLSETEQPRELKEFLFEVLFSYVAAPLPKEVLDKMMIDFERNIKIEALTVKKQSLIHHLKELKGDESIEMMKMLQSVGQQIDQLQKKL